MRRELLAAILDNPDDDQVRQIYSDFLEEQGNDVDLMHAQLIRTQILIDQFVEREDAILAGGLKIAPDDRRMLLNLHLLEHRILATQGALWIAENAGRPLPFRNREKPWADKPWPYFTFRRGFVEEARYDLEEWYDVGPTMVRNHPIKTMQATDKRADNAGRPPIVWFCQVFKLQVDQDDLPPEVWDFLLGGVPYFPTNGYAYREYDRAAEAEDDLSQALLQWARKQPFPE